MDNKLLVIGMGCGNPQYILPIAKVNIELADTLVGAKRHIETEEYEDKNKVYMEDGLCEMLKYIKDNYQKEQIAVLVSGDTGYHSLLRYIKTNLKDIPLEVYPGVSSMSVMFSRLCLMWDDAKLVSAHGNKIDIVEYVRNYKKLGILTDTINTPKAIARKLMDSGIKDKKIAVGERLSYDDENIAVMSVEEAIDYDSDKLCVVVIYDEEVYI